MSRYAHCVVIVSWWHDTVSWLMHL